MGGIRPPPGYPRGSGRAAPPLFPTNQSFQNGGLRTWEVKKSYQNIEKAKSCLAVSAFVLRLRAEIQSTTPYLRCLRDLWTWSHQIWTTIDRCQIREFHENSCPYSQYKFQFSINKYIIPASQTFQTTLGTSLDLPIPSESNSEKNIVRPNNLYLSDLPHFSLIFHNPLCS